MQSLTGNEPHLELGDTGEWVMQAQVRLYLLGYFRQWPDGAYNDATESAVRLLQSDRGLDNDGEMSQAAWEAILYFEQQAGIDYYWLSPYDALDQIQYDLENPSVQAHTLSDDGQWQWDGVAWVPADAAGRPGGRPDADGRLSDDGQWRWDGSSWQPASGSQDGPGGADGRTNADGQLSADEQLSADGQWRWDGSNWIAATPSDATGEQPVDWVGHVSDDGQWRWDGHQWQAA